MKRVLLAGCGLAVVIAALAGCGGSGKPSAAELLMEKQATLYQIDQIEAKFHLATSTQNIKLMMSLWAPGAVFNIDDQTLTGKGQIRHWFAHQGEGLPAREPLGVGHPLVQAQGDRERRQGNAQLRVPLHRPENGSGGVVC